MAHMDAFNAALTEKVTADGIAVAAHNAALNDRAARRRLERRTRKDQREVEVLTRRAAVLEVIIERKQAPVSDMPQRFVDRLLGARSFLASKRGGERAPLNRAELRHLAIGTRNPGRPRHTVGTSR